MDAQSTISDQERRVFEHRLRSEQERLRREVEFAAGASTDWERASREEPDIPEHGALSYERDTTLTVVWETRNRLSEIEDALKRIAAGTFGICERCGELIEAERLEAMPEARYCVQCSATIKRPERA